MYRIKMSIPALFMVMMVACGQTSQENKETVMATEPEWIDMLANDNLSRWHNFNKPDSIGGAWSLKDGVLHLNVAEKNDWQAKGGGDIVFDEVFDNFHLQVEWKISENGNSGIMFLVQEDTAFKYPWQTGPEMQILHNEGHPDGKITKHRAGDLYDLISVSKETVKGPGEWNLAEVMVKDKQLDFFLNGEKVVSTTLWDSSWNNLIANSKFKEMPGFGIFQSGKIALQDHGDAVWFRNVKIRRL
jgi:hypothetical protein